MDGAGGHADFDGVVRPAEAVFKEDAPGGDAVGALAGGIEKNAERGAGGAGGGDGLAGVGGDAGGEEEVRGVLAEVLFGEEGDEGQMVERGEGGGVEGVRIEMLAIEGDVLIGVEEKVLEEVELMGGEACGGPVAGGPGGAESEEGGDAVGKEAQRTLTLS